MSFKTINLKKLVDRYWLAFGRLAIREFSEFKVDNKGMLVDADRRTDGADYNMHVFDYFFLEKVRIRSSRLAYIITETIPFLWTIPHPKRGL